jgi:hypothetical protein
LLDTGALRLQRAMLPDNNHGGFLLVCYIVFSLLYKAGFQCLFTLSMGFKAPPPSFGIRLFIVWREHYADFISAVLGTVIRQ